MPHSVFIALGSNLGDRLANLHAAMAALTPEIFNLVCSPIYETPPWGYLDQPKFLNQVIQAETDLQPIDLLSHLKRIETLLGRQPAVQYGPRLVDLDILFFDDLMVDSPPLTIPHPRLEGRGFVLLPLAQLAPDLRHPVLGITIREMLAGANIDGIRWYSQGECS